MLSGRGSFLEGLGVTLLDKNKPITAADLGLKTAPPPKTNAELLIEEARAQTKLQQSMVKSLKTIATAATLFTLLLILGLVVAMVQSAGHTR